MYVSAKEEIKLTVHAWWGAEMLAQSASSVQDVEALAKEAECALQVIVAQNTEEIARLT